LSKGDKVELRGFGTQDPSPEFRGRAQSQRTGSSVDVPQKRVPFFKVGKRLREPSTGWRLSRRCESPLGALAHDVHRRAKTRAGAVSANPLRLGHRKASCWPVHQGLPLLNRYPYAAGHSWAVVNRHVGTLPETAPDEVAGAMELVTLAISILSAEYRPEASTSGSIRTHRRRRNRGTICTCTSCRGGVATTLHLGVRSSAISPTDGPFETTYDGFEILGTDATIPHAMMKLLCHSTADDVTCRWSTIPAPAMRSLIEPDVEALRRYSARGSRSPGSPAHRARHSSGAVSAKSRRAVDDGHEVARGVRDSGSG